jgi:hypothetical protein
LWAGSCSQYLAGGREGGCDVVPLVMWDGTLADAARCGGPGARVRVVGRLHSWGTANPLNHGTHEPLSVAVIVAEIDSVSPAHGMMAASGRRTATDRWGRGALPEWDETRSVRDGLRSVAAVDATELRPAAESPHGGERACPKRSSREPSDHGNANGMVGCA